MLIPNMELIKKSLIGLKKLNIIIKKQRKHYVRAPIHSDSINALQTKLS